MLGTQLYRFRGRISSTPVLMEAHIWMGVLGAICAFFHTAFVFTDPIAIVTFSTMMLAVLTGGIGRYVVYLVPRTKLGTELHLDEVNQRIQKLNAAIESGFTDAKSGYTAIIRLSDLVDDEEVGKSAVQEGRGGWRAFLGQILG